MKTMEQFWNEITTNKALAEKLAAASGEQKLEAFLKENEVDCTKEQFGEFIIAKAKESGALSDDKLESVAGGYDYKTILQTVKKGTKICHIPTGSVYVVDDCIVSTKVAAYFIKPLVKNENAPEMTHLTHIDLLRLYNYEESLSEVAKVQGFS
ncbi:MAG: hypothetical protein ACI4SX_01850 [Candidatus Fimenecus sp.]